MGLREAFKNREVWPAKASGACMVARGGQWTLLLPVTFLLSVLLPTQPLLTVSWHQTCSASPKPNSGNSSILSGLSPPGRLGPRMQISSRLKAVYSYKRNKGLQGLRAEWLRWEELRTLAPPQANVHSKLLGEELRPLTPPLAMLGPGKQRRARCQICPVLKQEITARLARGGATTAPSPAGKCCEGLGKA